MAKFRKKPVVVEAVQFFPENAQEVLDFIGSKWPARDQPAGLYGNRIGRKFVAIGLWVRTFEGDMQAMQAMPGDWIIKGVKGEFSTCRQDIFEATYEPVE